MRIAHRARPGWIASPAFHILRERLRADFDAEPSRGTQECSANSLPFKAELMRQDRLPGPPGALMQRSKRFCAYRPMPPLRAAAFTSGGCRC